MSSPATYNEFRSLCDTLPFEEWQQFANRYTMDRELQVHYDQDPATGASFSIEQEVREEQEREKFESLKESLTNLGLSRDPSTCVFVVSLTFESDDTFGASDTQTAFAAFTSCFDQVKTFHLVLPSAARDPARWFITEFVKVLDDIDEDEADRTGDRGLLVFHYAGHGGYYNGTKQLAFAGKADGVGSGRALEWRSLESNFQQYVLSGAHQWLDLLVILDSCHSGLAATARSSPTYSYQLVYACPASATTTGRDGAPTFTQKFAAAMQRQRRKGFECINPATIMQDPDMHLSKRGSGHVFLDGARPLRVKYRAFTAAEAVPPLASGPPAMFRELKPIKVVIVLKLPSVDPENNMNKQLLVLLEPLIATGVVTVLTALRGSLNLVLEADYEFGASMVALGLAKFCCCGRPVELELEIPMASPADPSPADPSPADPGPAPKTPDQPTQLDTSSPAALSSSPMSTLSRTMRRVGTFVTPKKIRERRARA